MISQDNLFNYLKKKNPNFIQTRKAKTGELLFSCPNLSNHKFKSQSPTATFSPSGNVVCLICGYRGSLYDAIRTVEPNYKNKTDAEITIHLIDELKLNLYPELDAYEKYGFALIPLLQNSKNPFEKGWTESSHKDKVQWIKWLNNNLNIGIQTGEKNGITVIDLDNKGELTEEKKKIKEELDACQTLMQNTVNNGIHYVFKYDKELEQTVNIGEMHIDIRNGGGQIVAAPSKIDIKNYSWKNLGAEIKIINSALKTKLLELMKIEKGRNLTEIPNQEKSEMPKLRNNNLDGCCNDTFTSIGGMLIKQLTPEHTEFVLNIMNRHLLENPMPSTAIKGMLNSLAEYKGSDEETEQQTVYNYLRLMQSDVTPRDIMDSTKLPRAIVDKYLSKFIKEGKAVRMGRGRYQYKEKIEWSDSVPGIIAEYKHQIPFFNNYIIFSDGDTLILGGKPNDGKTTISLNILKQMIDQDVKPYYVFSESGSRFQKTSQTLEIAGKYYHTFHENPLAIELEYNAFTVLDWLCLENKAETDIILKHLNNELQRKKGILVIFTQLKQDNEWFAPNLITHFPTFAARYYQDNPEKTIGHWQIDKVKETKGDNQISNVACEFDHKTKIFKAKDLL